MLLCFFFVFLIQWMPSSNQDVSDIFCCSKVTGSCRTACQQMSTAVTHAGLREKKLKVVKNLCPNTLVNFWQCFSEKLKEIERGDGWSGRHCCHMAQSQNCQNSCIIANHRKQLTNCRQSDELDLFSCLDHQERGDDCCGQAKTAECLLACLAIFKSKFSPQKSQRDALLSHCSDHSTKVIHCSKNLTKTTPATNARKYLHCCDISTKRECRDSCVRILKGKKTIQEIVDGLQEECGPPLPHDELWQCFLHNEMTSDGISETALNRVGMDAAKQQCCVHAVSSTCRRLCVQVFTGEWMESWAEFNRDCLTVLSEERLQTCIDEVEEPCELGCDGLNYCSNFNNRPTNLFRSCSTVADEAARQDVELWTTRGSINLPGMPGVELPVRNISQCSPEWWKSVACAMQIKPCHTKTHSNRICKEICYDILTMCIDWTRMSPGPTVDKLCGQITTGVECVSLATFMEPSNPFLSSSHFISAPCKHRPCDSNELCVTNKNCQMKRSCSPYQCLQGCRLGEASNFIVPVGTYVRVPLHSGNKSCVKICACTENGFLEKCQPLPCVPVEDCWLGNKKIDHKTTFYSDCNLCTCHSGELTCSKRQCLTSVLTKGWTSLPCNCPAHYVPVCGRNGATYPNQCLAKCAGLTELDFEFGECVDDPCAENPCPDDLHCVPARRVCLSLLENPCQQYTCVDPNKACSEENEEAVCDIDQQEHTNLCYMVRAGQTPAYRGHCRTGCQSTGQVCGADGVTYDSECQALAEFSSVDYEGPCTLFGTITQHPRPICVDVVCPRLPSEGCLGATPPGACCPVCAGALRILFSRKLVDRALYALQGTSSEAISLKSVLEALQRQIQVAHCRLWGYLTVETDLFVAVEAPVDSSALQRDVCVREAEKIASHIERNSPRYLTELSLSILTAARPIHEMAFSAAARLNAEYVFILLSFYVFVI